MSASMFVSKPDFMDVDADSDEPIQESRHASVLNLAVNGPVRAFLRDNPGVCRRVILSGDTNALVSMGVPDEPMQSGGVVLIVYSEASMRVDHVYFDTRRRSAMEDGSPGRLVFEDEEFQGHSVDIETTRKKCLLVMRETKPSALFANLNPHLVSDSSRVCEECLRLSSGCEICVARYLWVTRDGWPIGSAVPPQGCFADLAILKNSIVVPLADETMVGTASTGNDLVLISGLRSSMGSEEFQTLVDGFIAMTTREDSLNLELKHQFDTTERVRAFAEQGGELKLATRRWDCWKSRQMFVVVHHEEPKTIVRNRDNAMHACNSNGEVCAFDRFGMLCVCRSSGNVHDCAGADCRRHVNVGDADTMFRRRCPVTGEFMCSLSMDQTAPTVHPTRSTSSGQCQDGHVPLSVLNRQRVFDFGFWMEQSNTALCRDIYSAILPSPSAVAHGTFASPTPGGIARNKGEFTVPHTSPFDPTRSIRLSQQGAAAFVTGKSPLADQQATCAIRQQRAQKHKVNTARKNTKETCDALLSNVADRRKSVENEQAKLYDTLFAMVLGNLRERCRPSGDPSDEMLCPTSAVEMFDLFQENTDKMIKKLSDSGKGARERRVESLAFVHEHKDAIVTCAQQIIDLLHQPFVRWNTKGLSDESYAFYMCRALSCDAGSMLCGTFPFVIPSGLAKDGASNVKVISFVNELEEIDSVAFAELRGMVQLQSEQHPNIITYNIRYFEGRKPAQSATTSSSTPSPSAAPKRPAASS